MGQFKFQQPKNRELSGGDLVAQTLKNLGVDVAFGLHGGHLDSFLVGAYDAGIKLIDTRHETTAVQAAEGYAKVSGKTGVCFVTANSGFCNGLPGLASAFADRSPIFCVTSSPPLQDAETNALQGFHDQVVVAKPLTKFAHRVTNVEEIPRIVAYAFRAANMGSKGPVLVDFPIDILFSPPQMTRIALGAVDVPPADPPAPNPASVDRVIEAWKSAHRPVIIHGTGVSGAGQQLKVLAEKTQTPVFYSNKFSTPIPADHELRGGPAGGLASIASKEQADFVLLLGGRTGFLLGGRSGAIIPTDATVAQVDLDGAEIGKTHAINIGVISDVGLFCEQVVAKASGVQFTRHDDWIKNCRQLCTKRSPFENDPKMQKDGQIHPYHAMAALMSALPRDSIIIFDGGEVGVWAAMCAELAAPKTVMNSTGYLGFLGNGWGYSIGAAIADPSRLIVNIQGDGSAGFHIQELDTYARHGLNILTVVGNNYVWGMSANGQDIVLEGKTDARPAIQLSKDCAYEIVAQGFNCKSAKVTEYEQIQPTVEKLSGSAPALINIIVSVKPTSPATTAMVAMTKDPNASLPNPSLRSSADLIQYIVVPYYDNVPRPHYKTEPNGQANGHS